MRAVVYARFSSDRQRDRSIEDQISLCRTIAERENLQVIEVFEDRAISGSKADRPGFVRLMQAAKARQFDVLVVEDQDRLTRSQSDFHACREALGYLGIKLLTANGGYVDRLSGSVKAIMNELFLTGLADHTRRGQFGVVADGRHAGGVVNYGYRSTGERGILQIDEAEAEIVRSIYADFAAGQSALQIANALNKRGVPAPRGKLWSASQLSGRKSRENGILGNPIYSGQMVWNRTTKTADRNPETGRRGTIVNDRSEWKRKEVPHLRIVSDDLFDRVQSLRVRRNNNDPRSGAGAMAGARAARKPRHVLSGLIKCAACGAGLQSIGLHGGRARLQCSSHRENGSCPNARIIYLDSLLAKVSAGLREHLANPTLINAFVATYNEERRRLSAAATSARPAMERRLTDIDRECANLVEAIKAGGSAVSVIVTALQGLEAEKDKLSSELASMQADNVIALLPSAVQRYRRVLDQLGDELGRAGPEEITVLRNLISGVTVDVGDDGSLNLDVRGRIAHLCCGSMSTPGADRTHGALSNEKKHRG
ncbi:hypothetical protein AS156_01410 [Bradyrhizobium macuxiense]|uniref:DNA invertase Pin-like site-specific DNA recombinase n=1 Tax=Bradyrhizobium macuxiense TaxID=1755647 RepID=A0A120FHT2_9BRAD|nr:recombinase family protein [Bradyrhizobium macuxiense]KWV46476.1 hypothetical protein AS156_01410 [Bradyrhizobium macuxiense]